MERITTVSGFECEISEDVADDYELIEAASDMNTGGTAATMAIPKFVKAVVGNENYKRLKDHCRGENGRVSMTRIVEEAKEIMSLLSDSKKK